MSTRRNARTSPASAAATGGSSTGSPPHAGVVSHAPDANIRTAFHGTSWYALRGLLRSGRVLESKDEGKGHTFHEPGAGRESEREPIVREVTVRERERE